MSDEPPSAPRLVDLADFGFGGAKSAAWPSCRCMAIHPNASAASQRTLALLAEIAGGPRAVQLRGQVAAVKRGATREQIEEAFQEACLKAARSCRGQTLGEVYLWLLRTTDTTVDDMRDRLRREVLVDHCAREFQSRDEGLAAPEEVVIKREERAELDALTRAILERLGDRARDVAVLHCHGSARKDIARRLGTTPRIIKRDVEGILATGRDELTKTAGCGCEDGQALICRYAFGLAGERETRHAEAHLTACAQCATLYERLDLWRERVAAMLPLPPAIGSQTDWVERVVPAASDALTTSPPATTGGLRQQLSHGLAQARDHAIALAARTNDPTPLAGARPGAVAAAVAGCLAVGGGATYCVKQSTDPISAVTEFARSADHDKPKDRPRPKEARAAQAPAPAVVTPVAAPPPAPPPPPPPPPPPATTTTQQQLPPAPEDEFEPSSVSASSQTDQTTTGQAVSARARQPAPAPADGIGEFDGP